MQIGATSCFGIWVSCNPCHYHFRVEHSVSERWADQMNLDTIGASDKGPTLGAVLDLSFAELRVFDFTGLQVATISYINLQYIQYKPMFLEEKESLKLLGHLSY